MIKHKVFIKYWRLEGLSLVAAVERMLEMEGKNEKEIKRA